MMKDIGKMHSVNRSTGVRRFLFLLMLAVTSTMAWAQGNVSGKVVDATGEPVIGASVVVKGTTTGVVTDIDGNFSIPNVPRNANLEISYIGFKTQSVSVSGKNAINVTLQEDRQMLDDVVVVGYGVQKKSDVTGAMASVSTEELNARPVNNALEALQGKAAGVDITTNERPGSLGSIRIRGERSLTAGNADASQRNLEPT